MNQTPNKIWLTGIALEEHSVYQPRRQDKPTQSVYFLQKKNTFKNWSATDSERQGQGPCA